jgi:hypothetical protein
MSVPRRWVCTFTKDIHKKTKKNQKWEDGVFDVNIDTLAARLYRADDNDGKPVGEALARKQLSDREIAALLDGETIKSFEGYDVEPDEEVGGGGGGGGAEGGGGGVGTAAAAAAAAPPPRGIVYAPRGVVRAGAGGGGGGGGGGAAAGGGAAGGGGGGNNTAGNGNGAPAAAAAVAAAATTWGGRYVNPAARQPFKPPGVGAVQVEIS